MYCGEQGEWLTCDSFCPAPQTLPPSVGHYARWKRLLKIDADVPENCGQWLVVNSQHLVDAVFDGLRG